MTDSVDAKGKIVTIEKIREFLPHRYPFLLIDRVVDYELDQWLKAIKNVTINEPFFTGHFPDHPVMPGVLILEAMAQSAGILVQLSAEDNPSVNPLFYLVKIDKARFSRTVVPGDQLLLEIHQKRMLRKMGLYQCQASVDGETVATAEILCAERS
ncbi:MAG: 3-hydroxyacyl-ACP dehydratase FabZ [Xanthomonadales bacterium]|nr:3-hydroxyacyl-ACP dehydratase FabZ [Xanthomonadales bacterium]